jgi:hypothetical protein
VYLSRKNVPCCYLREHIYAFVPGSPSHGYLPTANNPWDDISTTSIFATYGCKAYSSPSRPDSHSQNCQCALRSNSVEIHRLDDHLYRSYRITDPSNLETFCVLKCPPAPNTRLLRHEHDRLSTESHALQLLSRRRTLPATQQPAILDHQATSFTLIGPFSGIVLSDLETPLPPSRRRILDRNLGQHIRRLNAITCPTFGPLQRPQHHSWARCFAAMMLEAIRDAEDGLVSLPYSEVKSQLRRHWDCLESVSEARLTVAELPVDGVVFDERNGEVRGLIDYGSAMWADPLLGDCFLRASDGFLEGYGAFEGEDQKVRRLL